MSKKINIGIVGFGNIGASCAEALSKRSQYIISVYDIDPRKGRQAKKFSWQKNSRELIATAEIIILAIKPQDFSDFLAESKKSLLKRKPLLVSVAAGIPASWFEKRLKGISTIRVIPNLAAKVGESMSFVSKGRNAKKSDLTKVVKIFSCIGEVIVIGEKYLDKVTAVTGSGPGYAFYFMESMYQGALELGFNKKQAKRMITQTFLGAAKLAKASGDNYKALIKGVASKKGTTEAALEVFRSAKINRAIIRGMKKACQRAKKLSKA